MRIIHRVLAIGAAFAPAVALAIGSGALDPTFGTNGKVDIPGYGLAQQSDGMIVALGAGGSRSVFGSEGTFSLARLTTTGAVDFSRTDGVGSCSICGASATTAATLVQPDQRIVSVGTFVDSHQGCFFHRLAATRHLAGGGLDPSFGSSGVVNFTDVDARAVALQPDGKAVIAGLKITRGSLCTLKADISLVRLNADGSLDPAFGSGGSTSASLGTDSSGAMAVAFRADGRIVTTGYAVCGGSNTCLSVATFSASGALEASAVLDLSPIGDLANAIVVQADGNFVVGGYSGANFVLARFTAPGALDPAFGLSGRVTGTGSYIRALALQPDGKIVAALGNGDVLRFHSNGQRDTGFGIGGRVYSGLSDVKSVALQADGRIVVGSATQVARIDPALASPTLTAHYYQSILGRAPDSGGYAFWQEEAGRVAALDANVNETWFAMAQAFFFSAEYAALGRDNAGFVGDLYRTFFNREPDTGGHDFWVGQLASGMPREVVLVSFMMSPEFRNFAQAMFGSTAARAEVDVVMDFYRGLLARLPDDGGFQFWVGRFRAAQCAGAAAVTAEAEAISKAYVDSGEYAARGRTNPQYVGDLYNAFLRRGGDLNGVQFWVDQLATGARTRDQVRVEFRNSPEFQARVNAVIAQGCL